MKAIVYLFFIITIFKVLAEDDSNYEDDDIDDVDDDDEDEGDSYKIIDFVGTNLFGDKGCPKKCFSAEDVALLTARRDFEGLIPKNLPKCLFDDHLVEIVMQYFYITNQVILRMSSGNTRTYTQKAFFDALGGFLTYYLIPVTRYSFYAGTITLKTTQNIAELLRQSRLLLNTNGNGWRPAISDFSDFDSTADPIVIDKKNNGGGKYDPPPCVNLIIADEKSENEVDMIVSLPKLEPEEHGQLTNIWLPFKRKHIFNLKSCSSAYVFLRYYVSVTRCYQFQGTCQDAFNSKLKEWLQENIEIHLTDDVLYPGLGGVLRVLETVRHQKPSKRAENSAAKRSHGNARKTQEYLKMKSKAGTYSDTDKNLHKKFFEEDQEDIPPNLVEEFAPFDDQDTSADDIKRRKYVTMAVVLSLSLLVLVLLIAVIRKMKKDSADSKKDNDKDKEALLKQSSSKSLTKVGRGSSRESSDKVLIDRYSSSVVPIDRKQKVATAPRSEEFETDTSGSHKTSCCGRKKKQPKTKHPYAKKSPCQDDVCTVKRSESNLSSPHHSPPSSPNPKKSSRKSDIKVDTIDEKGKRQRYSTTGRSTSADIDAKKNSDIDMNKKTQGKNSPRDCRTNNKKCSEKMERSTSWETIDQYSK